MDFLVNAQTLQFGDSFIQGSLSATESYGIRPTWN